VRPGAVRHDVTGTPAGVHAIAFANGGHWTVVVWNESASVQTFGLELPQRVKATAGIVTNASTDLGAAALPAYTTTGTWRIQLPPSTIATYTFDSTS
jgi:hypothetical protein